MFWPLELNPSSLVLYLNSQPNFCQNLYPNNPINAEIINPYAYDFFNFSQTHASFSQNASFLNFGNSSLSSGIQNPNQNKENPNIYGQKKAEELSSSNQVKQKKQSSESQNSIKMVRFRRRRKVRKEKNKISHNSSIRNDTKNIPKNYGKAMLAYIQKHTRQLKQLLYENDVDFMEFMMNIKKFKCKINTIYNLREMWGENSKEDKIKRCIRILSYHFMRKICLPYIFNSRVKNYHTHIKYRKKIMEGIANPQKFTKIKEF